MKSIQPLTLSVRALGLPVYLLILFAANPLTAAEDADPPGLATAQQDEETMIVTAHRVEFPANRVGSSVSTIDRTLLDNRQSVFAVDVLQDLPSVAVSRTAGFGSLTDVRIRGAEANQVLVVIDGVEVNDPALGDTFDFAALTSYDIDRIEVLRGPQSALWGSDAAAGVINIRTREGAQGVNGSGFLEGGSSNTVFGGGNASWNTDQGGVSINASYFDTDGEDATVSEDGEGDEDDGYNNISLALTSRWRPTDTTQLSLFSRYTEGNSEYDGTDFSTGLPADADNESDDELLLLSTSASITLFDDVWDQSIRVTYLDSDHKQSTDGIENAKTGAEKVGVYYQSAFNLPDWASFESQHLILAIDYEDEDFTQSGIAFGAFDPNQDQSMDNTGYVAEFMTQPLSALSVSASIRYDDNSEFDDVTTYRFTSSYLISASNTRLHASYGEGQKSPTFIERFGFYPDQFLGNPDLEPEKNTGFDVGMQQWLFGDTTSIDVTYFSERLENEINGFAFDPDSGLFTAENLNGKSRRDGIEVELSSRLGSNLTVTGSYTYTDSRAPDTNGGRSRELRRPKHMAALNLNQRLLNGRANVNVNVSYSGDQRDRFFPPFPAEPETVKLDSYVLVDLTGSFAFTERVEVYARANNSFDETYQNVFGYRSPERAVYGGVRMKL